jgi:hypothetical protein
MSGNKDNAYLNTTGFTFSQSEGLGGSQVHIGDEVATAGPSHGSMTDRMHVNDQPPIAFPAPQTRDQNMSAPNTEHAPGLASLSEDVNMMRADELQGAQDAAYTEDGEEDDWKDEDDDPAEDDHVEPANLPRKKVQRKRRQPRKRLCKWEPADWEVVVCAMAHNCGRHNLDIQWEEVAKMVHETCTGSALQQAILKLWKKTNNSGRNIPRIHMHWPKRSGGSATKPQTLSGETSGGDHHNPTKDQSTQTDEEVPVVHDQVPATRRRNHRLMALANRNAMFDQFTLQYAAYQQN